MNSSDALIDALKALAEPSRLRLLQLCRTDAVAVSELAHVLGASEPSVSRHLKLLEAAGLLRRARQGQRIYFTLCAQGAAAVILASVLEQHAAVDPSSRQDRQRLAALRGRAARSRGAVESSPLGRALVASAAQALHLAQPILCARVLRLCQIDLLAMLASASEGSPGMSIEVSVDDALQRERLQRWLSASDRNRSGQVRVTVRGAVRRGVRRDARVAASADLLVVDCSDATASEIAESLQYAASQLAPSGHLWLFANYDALDGGIAAEHPLMQLRRLLAGCGFHSARLQPIEADGAHILFSVATHAARNFKAIGT